MECQEIAPGDRDAYSQLLVSFSSKMLFEGFCDFFFGGFFLYIYFLIK